MFFELIILLELQNFVHKRTRTGTILVVADVLRPLAPPVGVNHEKLHTYQHFPLHPVPVYTTGGASDLNTVCPGTNGLSK